MSFTVNDDGHHLEKSNGGCQKKNGIVTCLCKRWVLRIICVYKWPKVREQDMRSGNGGGGDRPRPSRVIANHAGIGLDRTRGSTVPRAQISGGSTVDIWQC